MKKQYITLSVLAVIALALVSYVQFARPAQAPDTADIAVTAEQSATAKEVGPIVTTLVIQDFTKPNITFEFERPITALEYLEFINTSDERLQLMTETYDGMGTLVTSMAGHVNGDDNKYWQYFVNGEMPMVAADQYMLSDKDTLEWKFISSSF